MKEYLVIAGRRNGVFRIPLGNIKAENKVLAKRIAKEKFNVKHIMIQEK